MTPTVAKRRQHFLGVRSRPRNQLHRVSVGPGWDRRAGSVRTSLTTSRAAFGPRPAGGGSAAVLGPQPRSPDRMASRGTGRTTSSRLATKKPWRASSTMVLTTVPGPSRPSPTGGCAGLDRPRYAVAPLAKPVRSERPPLCRVELLLRQPGPLQRGRLWARSVPRRHPQPAPGRQSAWSPACFRGCALRWP